jgi:hypothetical protein
MALLLDVCGFGTIGTTSQLGRHDLLALEVATVSQHGDARCTDGVLRLGGHHGELGAVVAEVGHLVRNDEVMGRIDSGLDVVADDAGAAAAGGHGASIGVR